MSAPRPGSAISPLPPEHLDTEAGTVTVTRVWPEKRSPAASSRTRLAVEALDTSRALRAGWYHSGTGVLELFEAWSDPRLPQLPELRGPGAVVVSHRPGRRAVVRRSPDGTTSGHQDGSAVEFRKLVRPGRAQSILDGVARAATFDGPFRTPQVLTHDESSVTFASLAGAGLHEVGEDDDAAGPGWARAWGEVLEAWREAVLRQVPASGLPVHAPGDEIGVLRRWTEQAMPVLRTGQAEAELFIEAVESAAVALRALPEVTPRPAHRDLHDKQLLWSADQGPGLLDVDTACLADPALDLGNLRAHASWRRRQGVWSTGQAETVRLAVDGTAAELSRVLDSPVEDAVAVYEQASLLRLLCVYAFRPRYAALADQMRGELHPRN